MNKIPCGRVLGHGESCCDGHLCDTCERILRLLAENALLRKIKAESITGLNAESLRALYQAIVAYVESDEDDISGITDAFAVLYGDLDSPEQDK